VPALSASKGSASVHAHPEQASKGGTLIEGMTRRSISSVIVCAIGVASLVSVPFETMSESS